jgi:hypothetical protein
MERIQMALTEEIWLRGDVHRETEFVGGLHASCGPNAAAMAEGWADQSKLGTLDVYHRMRAEGRCDANGASRLTGLVADAKSAGYRVDELGFRQPMPEAEWRAFFDKHVGRQAIVFETGNGQALRDALTGKEENARNLHYHFVMVAGWHPGGVSHHPQAKGRNLPPGWWCADGDNFVQGNVLEFYPKNVLRAAQPVGAFAVYPRAKVLLDGGNEGGHVANAIPAGWRDDGAMLTAPNSVVVIKGFREWVLAHDWDATDWPLAPERALDSVESGNPSIGAGTRQDFRMTSLGWTVSRGVYRIWTGQELAALQDQLARAQAQVAALQQQLATQQPATGGEKAATASA